MIVTASNGRRRSVRTNVEDIRAFTEGYALCTPEERALIQALLNEGDPNSAAALSVELNESLYRRPLVSIQQFIEDPYYLGDSMSTMYPELKKDLVDLFAAPHREAVLTGSIGAGKCVDGATELYDPIRGLRVTVEEACRVDAFGVAAFDGSGGVAHTARAARSGFKPLGWLVLESGVRVRMSPDHPVRTPWGYTPASELRAGDMVASLRRLPSPVKPLDVSDDIVIWVAYMLADGGSTASSLTFTNSDPRIHDEFESVTTALSAGGHDDEDAVRFIRNEGGKDGKAWTVCPRGMLWLQRRYDLQHPATHKRVPAEFYGLSDRQLALFLNRIWACDGWVCQRKTGRADIGIALASEPFIRDLQQLLLRLGIQSRVRPRIMHYTHNGERRSKPAWSLGVTDIDGMIAFLDAVGDVHGKEESCRSVRDYVSRRTCNPNADITPMDRPTMSRLRREIGPIPRDAWWPGTPGDQRLGHPTLARLRETYSMPDWCRWWPDVFWDGVVSYEAGSVLEPVYDVEVPGIANFAPGGLIIHNTYLASAAICRILYELSCLKNPQLTFGLSPGTEMVIMLISKNLVLAREVMKTSIDDKIKLSPYFMQHFTPRFSTDYTLFPHNIRMNIGSYGAERALGANIFSSFLDETNFPPKRSAQQINQTFGKQLTAANFDIVEKVYRSMVRRIKSRFQTAGGDFPGMVIMVSSAATLDSFTERKLREAKSDPTVFVRDHTAWTSKPLDHFCGKWFYVLCSKSSLRSRILEDGECNEISPAYLEENNAWMIEVPVEYREDFESNLEDSLRDIAGVSTQAISAFFQRVDAIDACIAKDRKHPFSSEVWISGSPATFDWDYLCRKIERRLPGGFVETAWAPKEEPGSPRWIHIDTSISGDSTGFVMGRISRWVEVVRRDGEGHAYTDTAPYYVIEAMLCIRPPSGDQIYMPDLRRLVYELQAHGFPIHGFSSDSFQYVEMHQQIRRHGIHTELISMDRTIDPFEELKSAIYEKRIEFYEYTPLLQELRSLEYDRVKGKIDHPRHCFTGETRIALADGMCPTFKELSQRTEPFYVYSIGDEGVCIARAEDAHVTMVAEDLVEVMLDNYQVVRCTPDHLFMTLDREWVQAQNLTPDVRLMPLYRAKAAKGGTLDYERVWCPIRRERFLTHRLAAGLPHSGTVVHHIDGNKTNNDPRNLEVMERGAHYSHHAVELWDRRRAALREGHRRYVDERGRRISSETMRRAWEEGKFGPPRRACSIEGCVQLASARGLCDIHYQRARRAGALPEKMEKMGENHRVLRVNRVTACEEVYDLSVPGLENFALASGVFVHNSSKDVSDALAGVVWGLRQQAARLPWAADADTPRVAVGHDHGWVSDMIPAEDVDLDEVRAARSAQSAHVLMPFFIGDD